MTTALRLHRPSRPALRAWVAAWLLAALPLYGLGGLAAQVLGPLHVHAHAPSAGPGTRHPGPAADRWLTRLGHAFEHAFEHAVGHAAEHAVGHDGGHDHPHAAARRHHHEPQAADVMVVAEPDHGDGQSSASVVWQVVAPGAGAPPMPARVDAGRWPAPTADRIDGRPRDRLERPPRA